MCTCVTFIYYTGTPLSFYTSCFRVVFFSLIFKFQGLSVILVRCSQSGFGGRKTDKER